MRTDSFLELTERAKASLIYKQTGNLRAVQMLLEHTGIETTVRNLGVDVEDAPMLAGDVASQRASQALVLHGNRHATGATVFLPTTPTLCQDVRKQGNLAGREFRDNGRRERRGIDPHCR